jgi:hypothetical protein
MQTRPRGSSPDRRLSDAADRHHGDLAGVATSPACSWSSSATRSAAADPRRRHMLLAAVELAAIGRSGRGHRRGRAGFCLIKAGERW